MSATNEFPPGTEVFPQQPIVAAPPDYVPSPPAALLNPLQPTHRSTVRSLLDGCDVSLLILSVIFGEDVTPVQ